MAEPIVISYSQLDARRQCPHKAQLAYVERWTTAKDETTAAGRGTLWHKLLDAHYTTLKNEGTDSDPEGAVAAKLTEFRRAGKDPDTLDLLEWMYEGYVEAYGHDEEWQVIAVEHRAQVPLLLPSGRKSRFELKMIIDLIVRDRETGLVWLIDHKSHATIPKSKELDLDDQFGLYTWGLRQLGHKPFGSVYNTARTQRNKVKPQPLDERFDRYLMTRTDHEMDTIAQDALATARGMYHRDDRAERHTNSDTCRWRCDYTDACLIGRKYGPERERQFLLDVGFRQDFTRH